MSYKKIKDSTGCYRNFVLEDWIKDLVNKGSTIEKEH